MPLQDELLDRRRNALLIFYLAAFLSACAVALVGKIPSFRTLLFALAIGSGSFSVVFLLRFLKGITLKCEPSSKRPKLLQKQFKLEFDKPRRFEGAQIEIMPSEGKILIKAEIPA